MKQPHTIQIKPVEQPDKAQLEMELWNNFVQGDDDCYVIIYKKYIGVLFQYGIQFSRNEEVIKDAIHDVFVKLYANRANLRLSVNIKYYLFTALKNHLYNIFNREISFDQLDEYDPDSIPDTTAEDLIIENADYETDEQNKLAILQVLTSRQREVIYYRFIQELKIEEICVLMNMNYQSVQNLIQRSIKKMRLYYKN